MTSEEIRAMFARRERAWALHDSASLTADFAEDCVLESPTEVLYLAVVRLRRSTSTTLRRFQILPSTPGSLDNR
jgi:hypothetical protein